MVIAFVVLRVYQLWQEGPWDLPKPGKGRDSFVVGESKKESPKPQLVSTKDIVDKNLFDPERGASRAKEAEASSVTVQRVRSMVLLGTAILGNSRYAILENPSDPRPPVPGTQAQAGQPNRLRLKLGDTVEGFKLSEIHEKKVVFTKGTSKVEVALDYFRKFDDGKEKAKGTAQTGTPVRPGAPRPPLGGVPAPQVTP